MLQGHCLAPVASICDLHGIHESLLGVQLLIELSEIFVHSAPFGIIFEVLVICDLSCKARVTLHMLVILVEHVAILGRTQKVRRSFAIVTLAERRLLADLVPEAVLFEVLLIKVLHVRLVHLILAQVIEDLLASIEIGLHSVKDVLD